MRIAFFTAGTIGAGHLVPGLAVERGLRRAGFRGEYRMFGPPLRFPEALVPPNWTATTAPPRALADPRTARETDVARALLAYAPDLLLVELFWAPLAHILPALGCRAWLLVRYVPKAFLAGPPGLPFDPRAYERVIGTEPVQRDAIRERIPALVVSNPDECRPPEALRRRLGVPDDAHLTIVMQAGHPGEAATLAEGAEDAERPPGGVVRVLDPFADAGAPLFPAAEWLDGADRILCGAGYSAFWEARWLGYHDRTEFYAFPRNLDDQAWRVTACARWPMEENGADVLARMVLHG